MYNLEEIERRKWCVEQAAGCCSSGEDLLNIAERLYKWVTGEGGEPAQWDIRVPSKDGTLVWSDLPSVDLCDYPLTSATSDTKSAKPMDPDSEKTTSSGKLRCPVGEKGPDGSKYRRLI